MIGREDRLAANELGPEPRPGKWSCLLDGMAATVACAAATLLAMLVALPDMVEKMDHWRLGLGDRCEFQGERFTRTKPNDVASEFDGSVGAAPGGSRLCLTDVAAAPRYTPAGQLLPTRAGDGSLPDMEWWGAPVGSCSN